MNRRVDVLFLIYSLGRGGAERQMSLLARTLHARGLRVVVSVFYSGGALEQELHVAGVPLLDLQKRGRWSNLGVIWRLVTFIRRHRPRVLHSYMPPQNVLALLLSIWLRHRECGVVCGIRTASRDSWRSGTLAGVIDSLHAQLLQFADLVVSNSFAGLEALHDAIPQGVGVVVPNGVECERFRFSPTKRAAQRASWCSDDKHVLLGVVGRLSPEKNHILAIDALRLVDESVRNVRLVFVGEGPLSYKEGVQAYAKAQGMDGRIIWAGPSNDLAATYSGLDLFCLCSVVEGFPNVLAEAMCAGLPCISTEVGDAKLLMGDYGWIVPPRDAVALSLALVEACRSIGTWDRERGWRRMVELFSADALADRTLAALSPFLGEGKR